MTMGTWRIVGVDKVTGEPAEFLINAENASAAEDEANARGFAVDTYKTKLVPGTHADEGSEHGNPTRHNTEPAARRAGRQASRWLVPSQTASVFMGVSLGIPVGLWLYSFSWLALIASLLSPGPNRSWSATPQPPPVTALEVRPGTDIATGVRLVNAEVVWGRPDPFKASVFEVQWTISVNNTRGEQVKGWIRGNLADATGNVVWTTDEHIYELVGGQQVPVFEDDVPQTVAHRIHGVKSIGWRDW